MSEAVFLLDADGRAVLTANPAAESLSGYTCAELVTHAPQTLFPALYQTQQHSCTVAVQHGQYLSIPQLKSNAPALLVPRHEQHAPLIASVSPLTVEQAHYTMVVMRDTAYLWESLRRIWQNEKLLAASRLISGLAHHMNNPLQAVHNSLHLLTSRARHSTTNEDTGTNGNGTQQHYLLLARQEVEQMIRVVQRMLDFHRPYNEGLRLLNVNPMLEQVTEYLQPMLTERGIHVVRELEADLPPVFGVSSHLRQVCESLIENAADAMPDGGTLVIRSQVTAVERSVASTFDDAETSGLQVVVSFKDTGRGIPPEELEKIFEPFYSTRADGTGLGLALSYGIVQRHNGNLAAFSHAQQGATFQLSLPAVIAGQPDPSWARALSQDDH